MDGTSEHRRAKQVKLDEANDKNQKDNLFAGYVARTCNPASGRLDVVDGLRLGDLLGSRFR